MKTLKDHRVFLQGMRDRIRKVESWDNPYAGSKHSVSWSEGWEFCNTALNRESQGENDEAES